MATSSEIRDAVQSRAGFRCEYCRMHQSLQGATFHIEHVFPRSRGGQTEIENLAFGCPSCNLHKSERTEAADPETGTVVPLFDPRKHQWTDHFFWNEYRMEGSTAIGRATVAALQLNSPRHLLIRQAEELFDLFPS